MNPTVLVRSLARIAREDPLTPKLLVSTSFGEGSELLRALSLHSGGWTALEVSTVGRFATRIASMELAVAGRRVLDRFGEYALLDEVLDEVLAVGSWERTAAVAEGVGFRESVANVVGVLRMSEVSPERVSERVRDLERGALLAGVLRGFSERLDEEGWADPAEVLRVATRVLSQHGVPLEERVLLVPGLSTTGLSGRFIEALQAADADVLRADGVGGMRAPKGILWKSAAPDAPGSRLLAHSPSLEEGDLEIELFGAASVRDELREVLRRVMAAELPWDQIEIVTPDPETYGGALHALSLQLGVPCSFGVGLSVDRTRPGRAITGYLGWVEGGFAANALRALLEAGDLTAPSGHGPVTPARLARLLREIEVGWGRQRYALAIERERARVRIRADRDVEATEERVKARERRLIELDALEATVLHLDRVTPWAPDPFLPSDGRVSPAELARGVLGFLELVPEGEGADEVARQDLSERLARIGETLVRPSSFESALTVLRKHLRIRVRAAWDEGSPPWKSTGGHVHLTDLAHGGLTGRRATFVVGLDAGRFPGPGHQDPVLLDADRRDIDAGLQTSGERLVRRKFELAVVASRVRGLLCFSYTAWESQEARSIQPAPVLLDAHRLVTGRPDATYADLQQALGPPCSARPGPESELLDADDVWLRALTQGPGGSRGGPLVREAFPRLGRGLHALETADRDEASAYRGAVEARPALLDPRENAELVFSASRLETLGRCPLRYLLRYELRIRPPDDPTRAPERWLDPLHRGSLLHRVFERTLRDFPDGAQAGAAEAVLERATEVLESEAELLRQELPVPTESVYRDELGRLRRDLFSFSRAVAEDGSPWVALELAFGTSGSDPVTIDLPSGILRLMGAVDRVDRVADGLRVVDYKTGSTFGFGAESGVFNGGRRLQHVLYAEAVEALVGESVSSVEFHFPTPRGRNDVRRFTRESVREGIDLIDRLLDIVRQGRFLPTDSVEDCTFCDFGAICRVRKGRTTDSPAAAWGKRNLELLPEYEELRAARSCEDRR